MKISIIIAVIIFLSLDKVKLNVCFNKLTCSDCITASSNCAWCYDKDYTRYKSRCETQESLISSGCVQIYYPIDLINLISNDMVSETNPILIRPQKVHANLRKGNSLSFNLEFRYSSSFPVDFYVLMDMSLSMKDDLSNMKTLSNEIATGLGNITKKYKLGIGSFVDKVVAPYATDEKACSDCEPAFGFRNVLSLNENINLFIKSINSMNISGNIDTPEGTLDAIMQAAVCERELNWTNKEIARKIIFLLTDEIFKIAGDGKLAGIIIPNDGLCHLNNKMEYSMSSVQDYPSVFSVKEKLISNRISVILAVTKDVLDFYTGLAEVWKEVNAKVAILEHDASNILDLVNKTIREIASTVTIFHNAPDGIQVEVESDCNNQGFIKSHQCTSVNVDQSVNFRITLKIISCISSPTSFNITIAGLAELEITLNASCNCDCEIRNNPNYEANSPFCNINGDLVCGICQCKPGKSGESCQCDIKTEFAELSANDTCINPNGLKDLICNGQGDCVCGSCLCYRRLLKDSPVYGKYCECSENFCPTINEEKCGGLKRGYCDCNKCICHPKFMGDYCTIKNCSHSDWIQECLDSKGSICGNHGSCSCGTCSCEPSYEGALCNQLSLTCQLVESCSKCYAFLDSKDAESCVDSCNSNVKVRLTDVDDEQSSNICIFRDHKSGCEVRSVLYRNESDSVLVLSVKKINKLTDCPKAVNVLVIAFSISGSIVLAGIVLIALWIISNKIYERRIFNQFESDKASSRWQKNENPLYKSNISGYKNPLYRNNNASQT